ncbi:TM0106 family RecB-like putative nuclease [Salinibacterium hongtaonis]|uniref:DNA helicase n=1 Tax=Homoserinimonas hongtaonis TaxID=2079791 RepID=A0A2U1T0C2_9MICO|nr:bifunctional RecB family nuclease/DEAD/DEAH box helicase [Salinibacterium hongtaonis]PWB97321.1 DNA helicase [Salinibacterium hongtaonis]
MFIVEDAVRRVVYTSASDLTIASKCEFAFLRSLDAKLGRIATLVEETDPMLARTGRLGDEHEERVLRELRAEHGAGVVEIERPDVRDRQALDDAVAATIEAFASGVPVVFQATFHEHTAVDGAAVEEGDDHVDIAFVGFADFIVRTADGHYLVQDTKLARSAKVTALLQLAAYAEQLARIGVPVANTVELLLGDGSTSEHRLADIAPVYRHRRARLHRIIRDRIAERAPVAWGDPRYSVCGQCAHCEAAIAATRDVLLVAGLRLTQRARLADAGVTTIEALAHSRGSIEGIGDSALDALREQALLQLEAPPAADGGKPLPPFRVVNAEALGAIPQPSPGDIFFDFEGDPLYTEGDSTRWGLDYLFGLVDETEHFSSFWAHTFEQERLALRAFLDDLAERRKRHPDLHVYHYAAYERTHLSSLAARHGIGEEEVDQLLRDHVLVDLYPVVRKAVRVGSRSYSIKYLEPLYMGDAGRTGMEVATAAASITEYADAMQLGMDGDPAAQQAKLDEIADYNRYDCVSTLRLRDWLLGLASAHGVTPVGAVDADEPAELAPTPLHDSLAAIAGDPLDPDRSADCTAAAFALAALDYHRREHKTFWWGHFARLVQPIDEWADTRDVLVVDSARVERDWFREGRQRSDRRHVRLTGTWGPGSKPSAGGASQPFVLYDQPAPVVDPSADPGARWARSVSVLESDDDSILIEETLRAGVEPYSALPVALTPASPPPAGQQKPAIESWAQAIVDAQPDWPQDAAVDILRRREPRTLSGKGLVAHRDALVQSGALIENGALVHAVEASLLDLDSSYLAVQGPPGTGKTYLGAHVIAELVARHGWKIGVVAQSHAVVENLLSAIVEKAGLPQERVGKVVANPDSDVAFTPLPRDGHLLFALDNEATGYVVGGTAWDFSNPARVPRRSLDLLVIDEAGQFSLASTIAASVAARKLLLLGDPQQLPQVSQGLHPEPVDGSALGWISDGHDVLPGELGYFLASSRRMHPAVADPVSTLSYEGELAAHPDASLRHLEGIAPGLHPVGVAHHGNSIESEEEAAVVIDLVRSSLGRAWSDPSAARSAEPLRQRDIIVVSPYNAQVARVAEGLAAAGFGDVRVGTVDKFQGQEAVVAIVTLAASAPADVPRGMSFLLMRNRLNVAVSRAQWAAFLVHSPDLIDYLPPTPAGVAELSAFITLIEQDVD